MSGLQTFALVDVEHAVIAQKGNGFLFARFLIRLLHHRLRSQLHRLVQQIHGKFAPAHAGNSGIILHIGRGGNLSSEIHSFYDNCTFTGTLSVNCRCHPRSASAYDSDVVHMLPPLPVMIPAAPSSHTL